MKRVFFLLHQVLKFANVAFCNFCNFLQYELLMTSCAWLEIGARKDNELQLSRWCSGHFWVKFDCSGGKAAARLCVGSTAAAAASRHQFTSETTWRWSEWLMMELPSITWHMSGCSTNSKRSSTSRGQKIPFKAKKLSLAGPRSLAWSARDGLWTPGLVASEKSKCSYRSYLHGRFNSNIIISNSW